MEKPIEVIFLKQAEELANSIGDKPKKKLFHAIRKTKERLFGQWFTKLRSSDGIFEYYSWTCKKEQQDTDENQKI